MNQMQNDASWKARILIIGAVTGMLLGVLTAYLMARTAEEKQGGPPQIKTGDMLKAGVSIVGLVRGIASLGDH